MPTIKNFYQKLSVWPVCYGQVVKFKAKTIEFRDEPDFIFFYMNDQKQHLNKKSV